MSVFIRENCIDANFHSLLSEALDLTGVDGSVLVIGGDTQNGGVEIVPGMELDRGYISGQYIPLPHIKETRDAIVDLQNALIILYAGCLSATAVRKFFLSLENIPLDPAPFLIIADSVSDDVGLYIKSADSKWAEEIIIVLAPWFGETRKAILQDIAVLTGATIIHESKGESVDEFDISDIGGAERLIVTIFETFIVKGDGSMDAIKSRCEQISDEALSTSSDYDREKLQKRFDKLSNGVAIISCGSR